MKLLRARIHRYGFREPHALRGWWLFKYGKLDDHENYRPNKIGLHLELSWKGYRWPLGLAFEINTEDHGVAWTFHVWRLFAYLEVEGVLPRRLKHWLWDKHHISDEIDVFALDLGSTIRWKVWLDGMQTTIPGTYKRAPGWRDGHIDLVDLLLGRTIYESVTLKEGIEVGIPLPEKTYPATAKLEVATWKRPRWPFTTRRESVWLEIPPPGLPHSGKGENSWDCGDDGIYGIGSDSHSLPKAIGHAVARTLEAREKYGNASWLRA